MASLARNSTREQTSAGAMVSTACAAVSPAAGAPAAGAGPDAGGEAGAARAASASAAEREAHERSVMGRARWGCGAGTEARPGSVPPRHAHGHHRSGDRGGGGELLRLPPELRLPPLEPEDRL